MNGSEKIVLLCDYGLDDAVATAYVLARRGEATVDIVPVAGNSPLAAARRNARTLLHALGEPPGVRLVDSSELPQNFAVLPAVHGSDGMGDIFAPADCSLPEITMSEWLAEDNDGCTLVSLGPCTVTSYILSHMKSGPGKLLIMAGNVCEKPNFEGREFNHALDRAAFAECVRRPHEIATLDSCRSSVFNLAGKEPPTGGEVFRRLAARAIELAEARHKDNCYIYDYIAVRRLFEPELFGVKEAVDPDGNRLNMLFART